MTETTATGKSAGQVEREPAEDHAPSGTTRLPEGAAAPDGDHGSQGSGADPDSTTALSATTEVSASDPTERRAFTRPPGMAPPPVELSEDEAATTRRIPAGVGVPAGGIRIPGATSISGSYPVVSANAPVSVPPRGGVTGRAVSSGVTVRPISPGAAVGSARVSDAIRASRSTPASRGPRRARLAIKRVDPWSVMKFSFAVSLVLFIVLIVAASVLYLALDTMGVFTSINTTLADLVESGGGDGASTFQITARGVIGTAAVLGAINVVLVTAMATLGAFVYNVCADLVGGVEVTLAERD